jgi:hypothetical protein
MEKSRSARPIARLFGRDFLNTTSMKQTLKNYVSQPSTWLGIAKLGAALGLYSAGIGSTVADAIIAVFGVIDVIRNEHKK